MPGSPGGWRVTTHDWSSTVDLDHLARIRSNPDRFCPGGPIHLLLEVLAYADDEARELGRTSSVTDTDPSVCTSTRQTPGRGTDTRRTDANATARVPVGQDVPVLLPAKKRRSSVDITGFRTTSPSFVAALSDWLIHTNRGPDGAWEQRYCHGVPARPLEEIPGSGRRGTTVHYLPSAETLAGSQMTPALIGETAKSSWLSAIVRLQPR